MGEEGCQPKAPATGALWQPRLEMETRADGTILVWQADPLGPYPAELNERLLHWANRGPDRPWMAQRDGRRLAQVTYGEALPQIRRSAQALLDRGFRRSGRW
jgi:feruloyl-CoA synthase